MVGFSSDLVFTGCGIQISCCAGVENAAIVKTSIDKPPRGSVFHPLFCVRKDVIATLPGSSVAEQVTVNHLVAGSIPARAAIQRTAQARLAQGPRQA